MKYKALFFDGIDDYVDCGNDESLDITDEITIEAWVNRRGNSGDQHNVIIRKSETYEIVVQESDRRVWWALNTANYWTINLTGYYLPNNDWHHLVLAYHKDNGGGLYVDGEVVQPIAADGPISPSGYNLGIGDNLENLGGWNFKGIIDEVRIYSRALSEEEIKRSYYHQPILDGLVLWLLPQREFMPIKGTWWDRSGKRNHGTIHGATPSTEEFHLPPLRVLKV